MVRQILLCLGLLAFAKSMAAQQLPIFAMVANGKVLMNPATIPYSYTFNRYNFEASLVYRSQWLGLQDAPQTGVAQFKAILPTANFYGGLQFIFDQTGKIGFTGTYGQLAYRLQFNTRTEQALAIGFSIGVLQYQAKIGSIFPKYGSTAQDNVVLPDIGIGLYYYLSHVFYAGIALPQAAGLSRDFFAEEDLFRLKNDPHLYFHTGGYINLKDSYLQPTLLSRYIFNAPLSYQLNLKYQYKKIFWLAAGYGSAHIAHSEIGFILGRHAQIKNALLRIGLSFDIPLADYALYFGNTVELTFSYAWLKKEQAK